MKLLGELLLKRANFDIMIQYVSKKKNLKVTDKRASTALVIGKAAEIAYAEIAYSRDSV